MQAYLKHCLQYVIEHCREDLDFFAQQNDKSLVQRLQVRAHSPASGTPPNLLFPPSPPPFAYYERAPVYTDTQAYRLCTTTAVVNKTENKRQTTVQVVV